MCRVFGCVASEPVSIHNELVDAENPMIRQSEEHDSGWGMAVYERAEGAEPRMVRFPHAAHADGEFRETTELRGRIFNVHVRRATMGGLTMENTHPFCLGSNSFGHNGTVLEFSRLLEPGVAPPAGQTDSEHMFNLLMRVFDPGDVVGSLRRTMQAVVERSPFSGLNFLFSDGERLYAYSGSGSSSSTGSRARGSCWWPRRRSPASPGTPCVRTASWCWTRATSRSRTPSGCWGTGWSNRRTSIRWRPARSSEDKRVASSPPSGRLD